MGRLNVKILVSDVEATNWRDAIHQAAQQLYKSGYVTEDFEHNCIEREMNFPTGLETEFPVAIPHTESEYVNETAVSVLRLTQPVAFQSMEDNEQSVKVHYVFNLAIKEKGKQVVFLSKIINLVQDSQQLKAMFELNQNAFIAALQKILD